MDEIRLLSPDEIRDYIEIMSTAFPILKINSVEVREDMHRRILRSIEEGASAGAFGCFRDGALAGGLRLLDFEMSLFGQPVHFGGIGGVAVALAHKKEKVARDLVRYALGHYDAKGCFIMGLYAFRPDFYRKMGFGFGAKTKQYRLSPARLPKGPSKGAVRLLCAGEKQLILDYCGGSMMARHGCVRFSATDIERVFETGGRFAGDFRDGRLAGYIRFVLEPYQGKYAMHISEFVYDDREALSELVTFLHSQADQFETILLETGDEYFHYMCENPANGDSAIFLHHQTNVEELGIMYRILSVRRFFESLKDHVFWGATACVRFNVRDSFFSGNDGSVTVRFAEDRAVLDDTASADVEVQMDISDFSAMALGVVPFSALYIYSRAGISDEKYVPLLDGLFRTAEKPFCHVKF